MNNRIVIAGGGTGGHIFPAVAVANALQEIDKNCEILFIGAKGKMEMEKVPAAGYKIIGLDISGFDRGNLWKNIWLPYKLVKSHFQVKKIFRSFRPQAAFGVGGYSSFPVLRFAQNQQIHTYIHEANAYGGKSNIWLSKKAKKVFVGTPDMDKFFPSDKILFTGNPVRKEILQNKWKAGDAKLKFGLDPEKITLFVVGGSLGARSINEAVRKGLNRWVESGYQLIWQTGKLFIDQAKQAAENLPGIYVSDFIREMDAAYSAADLVISRAGAMSVTELCIAGKAAIFVPFPFAAEDHQTANAMALVNREAAKIVKDSEANSLLMDMAQNLAKDEALRNKLSKNISPLAKRDADIVIAQEILKDIM